MTKLSTLILSYNQLKCLGNQAFSGLTSLRILSLHGNDLSTLPEEAFSNLNNISHIALGSNQLYCDCSMIWFSKWIKAKFIEPGISRCESPIEMRNKLLLTSNYNKFKCEKSLPLEVEFKCNACAISPCLNQGECIRGVGQRFTCKCTNGFYGAKCERKIDACYGEPCLNNGTCKIIEEGRFKCQCEFFKVFNI